MRTIINHRQKAQIAFAAVKGDKTLNELSAEYHIHPAQIAEWQALLRRGAPALFAEAARGSKDIERIEQLQKIIGERQEEIDWLKKKLPRSLPRGESRVH